MRNTLGLSLAAESHTAAIDRIEAIVTRESIECDFERRDGYLFSPTGEPADLLEHELQAARRAGLAQVELVPRAPLAACDTGPCLRFPRQGQFHPLKYLAGLAKAIQRMGGHIFTQTHVEQIESGPPARIRTRQGPTVTAAAVVVATNSPFNDRLAIHTKQAAYMSYVVGFGRSARFGREGPLLGHPERVPLCTAAGPSSRRLPRRTTG